MSPLAVAIIAFIALIVIFTAVWAWQVKSKNAGMIDPVWAISLGLAVLLVAALAQGAICTRAGCGGNWRVHLERAARPAPMEAECRPRRRSAVSQVSRV